MAIPGLHTPNVDLVARNVFAKEFSRLEAKGENHNFSTYKIYDTMSTVRGFMRNIPSPHIYSRKYFPC